MYIMMRIELPFDKRQLFEAMTSAQLHTLILQDDDDSKLALWYVLFFRIKDKLWLIEEMKGKGWLFTYIGANQDAIAVARAMNIHNAMNFVQDDSGTKEMFRKERKARERFNAKSFEAHAEVMACCASMPPAFLEERLKTLNKSMAESANYFEEDSDA